MNDPRDALRRRRCVALQLAIALGVALPIVTRTWISLAAAVIGVTVAGVTYWRECRDGSDSGA